MLTPVVSSATAAAGTTVVRSLQAAAGNGNGGVLQYQQHQVTSHKQQVRVSGQSPVLLLKHKYHPYL